MKDIQEFIRTNSQEGHIIASFFFNARGSELDRTPQGMYRSLLLQLLEPGHLFRSVIVDHFKSQTSYTNPEVWDPTMGELLQLVRRCLVETLYTSRVTVFLDALDECEAKHVRDLAYFLRELTRDANDSGRRLDVCISSRHYPHISISMCPEIILERENRNDILELVKFKIPHDIFFTREVVDRLRTTIMEKSSGIFLWVVLVIDVILRDIDDGRAFWEVQKTLDSVPTDLVTMFTGLLESMSAPERSKLRNLVHWLLLGRPNFQVNEISALEVFGRDGFDLKAPAEEVEAYVDDHMEQERQKRQVRSISRGLVEVSAGTAQFIHESVREFFLQHGFTVFRCQDANSFMALGHCMIIRSCVRAMLSKQLSKELNSSTQVAPQQLLTGNIAYNWLIKHTYRSLRYHVFSVQKCTQFPNEIVHGIQGVISAFPDLDESLSLKNLNASNIMVFALPDDWITVHGSPDRYLVKVLSRLEILCSDVMSQLCKSIVHPEAVENALYQRLRNSSVMSPPGKVELPQWMQTEESRLVSWASQLISPRLFLPDAEPGSYVKDTEGNTLLHFAAWLNLGWLVQVLIRAGHPIDVKNVYGMSPLHLACQYGQETAVQVLLLNKADINAGITELHMQGYTALHLAVQSAQLGVVKQLLRCEYCPLNVPNAQGRTPVYLAVRYSQSLEILDCLLKAGANAALPDEDGIFPSQVAVRTDNPNTNPWLQMLDPRTRSYELGRNGTFINATKMFASATGFREEAPDTQGYSR